MLGRFTCFYDPVLLVSFCGSGFPLGFWGQVCRLWFGLDGFFPWFAGFEYIWFALSCCLTEFSKVDLQGRVCLVWFAGLSIIVIGGRNIS